MKLFDSHCHLQWHEDEDPVEDRLQRSRQEGVVRWLCVAVDLASATRAKTLTQHEGVSASVGIHPNDVGEANHWPVALAKMQQLLAGGGFAAIGETGMDFFRQGSETDAQAQAFRDHILVAQEARLPLIIHCRDAAEATLQILQEQSSVAGVMHCWSNPASALGGFLDLGLHISFAGNLTYPKNEALREAARQVPADRLLVETDAPFLAPQAKRGKRNESSYLPHTLAVLAQVREESPEEVAQITWDNGERLFGSWLNPEPATG